MATYPVVGSPPGRVVCYYSSWAHYRQGLAKYTVEDIPVELCTHLIYAFATMDSKTFLPKPFDPWLDIDLKNYEKFVQLKKKNPKMKVLIGVGGWNDSRSTKYSRMVADSTLRRKFVEEAVKFLLQYGFDGLDLDWEYPGYESKREDKEGFTQWVEDLKRALAPHNLLLTTAVSASRRVIDRGYDIPKIAKHLDFINVMAYDFHGSWERVVAHHSPLYPEAGQNPEFNVDFAVNYWINKGMPADKVVLGVPFYGRSWTLAGSDNKPGSAANGAGKGSKYVKEKGHMAYYECCLAHQEDGWAKITGDGGPYLTKGDQWVGYDDIDAVTRKAEYAHNKGLGGVMVWDTVSDDFNNACGHGANPLLTAISRTLQGNSGVKGSTSFGGGSPQTNKLPYEWSAWPIFNKSPQDSQTSNASPGSGSSSFVTTPSTSTSRFASKFGGTTSNRGSSGFGGGSQTTKPSYEWLSWPIFNKSPQDTQNSLSSSFVTSPSTSSTTRFQFPSTSRFSSNFGGTTSNRGSTGSETTKPPFEWQSWPIFNKSPQDTQNSLSSSFVTPPSTSSTTRFQFSSTSRFSSNFGGTTSNRGSTGSETTKPAFEWQSWPIFNKSPQDNQNSLSFSDSFVTTPPRSSSTRVQFSTPSRFSSKPRVTTTARGSSGFGSGSTQTTKPPYEWLKWPIFSSSPEDAQNSVSSFSSETTSFPTPSSPSNFPSHISKFSSSSSALSWFTDCQSAGFGPDPASCSAFYRCTDNYAYRFSCPGGLLWHQDTSACDWPDAVQCVLPLSKPSIEAFRPPETSVF